MTAAPEEARAAAVAQLIDLGEERMRLMSRLAEIDKELRPRVKAAHGVGVMVTRIVQLTGLSRTTVAAWSKK